MANENRLISVGYAIQQIEMGELENGDNFQTDSSHIKDFLMALPVVKLEKGKWERFEELGGNIGVSCSACRWKDYHHGRYKGNLFNYCPNCGAVMDLEE